MPTAASRLLALSLSAASLLGPPAQAQDPFSQGQRWVQSPDPLEAWLPRDVHFAADENLVWASAGGQHPRWMALDVARQEASPARFVDAQTPASALGSRTIAAREGTALFGIVQEPASAPGLRTARVLAHSAADAARSGQLLAQWERTLPAAGTAEPRLATDASGDLVAAAAHDLYGGTVRLELLDGATGAARAQLDLPGLALSQLAVAEDGSLVAVAAGLDLYLLDGAGQLVHHQALTAALSALDISPAGDRVALGAIGQLVVLRNGPAGWVPGIVVTRPNTEAVTVVDLAADGLGMAVAWWTFASGTRARFELRQRATVVASAEQDGGSGGLQNLPRHAVVTADGQRAAFGTWGNGLDPEVLLLGAGADDPVAEFQLPGSVTGLDLDRSGRRIAVAHKDVHATAFGLTGSVRLLDTGEGDLRQLETLQQGGSARFATTHPEANVAFLLAGTRVEPVQLPGISGLLHLDRTTLTVLPALVDAATGWADHTVQLPSDPALIGTSLGLQAAFRTPAGTVLGTDTLDALVF